MSNPRIELGFPQPQCGVLTTILIRHGDNFAVRTSASNYEYQTFIYFCIYTIMTYSKIHTRHPFGGGT